MPLIGGSCLDLARALVERYVAADIGHLDAAVAEVTATTADPAERVIRFLRIFEDTADELMAAQSSCLYVSVLTERQLVERGTSAQIEQAILACATAWPGCSPTRCPTRANSTWRRSPTTSSSRSRAPSCSAARPAIPVTCGASYGRCVSW